jgi:hypothetical protein
VVRCGKKYNPNDQGDLQEFQNKYIGYLAILACESTDIASGILDRKWLFEDKRFQEELKKLMQPDQPPCPGLQKLSPEKKAVLFKPSP